MSAQPAIVAGENLSIIIAECPPGDKPMLHAHFHTIEHFFCLKGKFLIRWGDRGVTDDMKTTPTGRKAANHDVL